MVFPVVRRKRQRFLERDEAPLVVNGDVVAELVVFSGEVDGYVVGFRGRASVTTIDFDVDNWVKRGVGKAFAFFREFFQHCYYIILQGGERETERFI